MNRMFAVFVGLCAALSGVTSVNALTVPGTANPWLAGLPNGSTACSPDVAPSQSPVLYGSVVPGSILTFTVTGSTHHGGPPFGSSPDGGTLQEHIAENGISSNNVPISSLVGVFLDDSLPTSSAAPVPFDYQPSASVVKPGLKQVFFIGDGLTGTGTGTLQRLIVPAGATRLFLGTQDGCNWSDNGGSFTVSIVVHSNSLTVPGTANPWLAGLTNGSTATGAPSCPPDAAPAQSPVLFDSVVPGTVINFTVSGSTDHGGPPFGLSSDGGPLQEHIVENGIASNNVPISSLVGVFLDDSQPIETAAPSPFQYDPNLSIVKPGLKQVFFIGDGLPGTGSGIRQQFVVPTGASRLFLGTQDGCAWADNGGSFSVALDLEQHSSPSASIRVSEVEICWESLANETYQVQYKTNLNSDIWLNLGSAASGSGTNNCVNDSVLPGQVTRYYRVITLP